MLQQTRVEAVLPYYARFLQRFPTLTALAAAPEAEVLRYWAGLGYYSRARNLRAAAQQLESRRRLPDSAAAWRELPGIGEYTAAAIASITFRERVPVVDGNVRRVAARYLALDAPQRSPALHKAASVWGHHLMQGLAPRAHPGDLNQALMELGATVCTPRAPRCDACPLAPDCAARAAGEPERWPHPDVRRPAVALRLAFLVAGQGERWLLVRRSAGWNPGLYEPPSLPDAAPRRLQAAWKRGGSSGRIGGELGEIRHTITHHRIRGRVLQLDGWDGRNAVDPARVPLTGLARKVLAVAAATRSARNGFVTAR
ncbi:MAG: A/G-specific adenine glycosylase [Planctomycetota bacterium]|nr:MAG: A/G-specific adenine glycosylase [Planctomycetota bacterium]